MEYYGTKSPSVIILCYKILFWSEDMRVGLEIPAPPCNILLFCRPIQWKNPSSMCFSYRCILNDKAFKEQGVIRKRKPGSTGSARTTILSYATDITRISGPHLTNVDENVEALIGIVDHEM